MLKITSPTELRKAVIALKKEDGVVALVPTMGYIHQGHLEVVRVAQRNADHVIVSIFVNPTQFNDKSDYKKYPRDLEHDEAMLRQVGVDILYLPNIDDIYPEGPGKTKTVLLNPELTRNLCGATRQGHFEGVLLVVSKLLNKIQPDVVVLGEKDYQQFRILEYLVTELLYPTRVLACPIIREENGLAMSSRNARLSDEGREKAAHLHQALLLFRTIFQKNRQQWSQLRFEKRLGELDAAFQEASNRVTEYIVTNTGGIIDYLQILDASTLLASDGNTRTLICALAVFIEDVRLIDNIVLNWN